jgi:4-hydroxyacetophenone monooxygenase
MAFVVGERNVDEYFGLLVEELAPGGVDLRAPHWTLDEVATDRSMRVAVIGAGMSGLLAAHRLRQAGVEVVVLEKNPDVGGTWFDNTYPGCRVDVPNHLYSYSFDPALWPQHYSSQEVLREYFSDFADRNELRDVIRFDHEVTAMRWDEGSATWHLDVRTTDGTTDAVTANAVVSAVGQLNRPRMPDIAGMDTFAGPAFHSARWDHDVDLAGKRVDRPRGCPPRRVPTHPGVAGSLPRLPRRRHRRSVLAVRTPPHLRPMVPAVAVLAHP